MDNTGAGANVFPGNGEDGLSSSAAKNGKPGSGAAKSEAMKSGSAVKSGADSGAVERQAGEQGSKMSADDRRIFDQRSRRKSRRQGEMNRLAGSKADNAVKASTDTAGASSTAKAAADKAGTAGADRAADSADVQRRREFERLIYEEYRDLYSERVEGIVRDRLRKFRGSPEASQQSGVSGERENVMLGSKGDELDSASAGNPAGTDGGGAEIAEMSDEMREGYLKAREEMRKTIAKRTAEASREQIESRIGGWLRETEQLRREYPGFALENEMKNPVFISLIRSGASVKSAFEAANFEALKSGIKAGAEQNAVKKLVGSIRAGELRPSENGMGARPAQPARRDIANMTKSERERIASRAMKGEIIRL